MTLPPRPEWRPHPKDKTVSTNNEPRAQFEARLAAWLKAKVREDAKEQA